ncbi:MAG: hypothetical protein JNJ90_18790 [Saprospiraceae bacterium]|jgi:hypothetical protein|nr:hypothetical protein [Saprospiraceae bacterium]
MNPTLPVYDFNDPVFKMNLKLKRWAREHIELAGMHSDVISWEIAETVSPLRIPVVYHIHYRIRSIVGIDEAQNPVYGDHHVLSLALPPQYPLEGCKIYMLTDIWHPNVKWEGKYKGRVCGNTESFGLSYSLYQLVLRVGEILQYKNYHAIPDEEPYPEDLTVAKWVLEFAEPHGIVNKYQEIAVDDSPLVRVERDSDETTVPATAAPPPPQPVPVEPPVVPAPPPTPESGGIRIKIGAMRPNPEHKPKITITPRD